ncbi:DUF1573 domain-containing protein [Flavobacterium sp. WLB]|uniref:DUF1573 domain-containing protein n=1 Tax=unclassified Flavobacterium TaxID=196869 RepID=UPI0006ABEC31|nr:MULTISPECIES: DUF1573 domain-containing protein [unclassified Flavobacterium]KOP36273.1 hypothetical protein AKO67_20470 [Flavobacterium sp. VMW]MDR6760454.1 hypothetical protein [Flavobacterium sp. 2755]OWU90453.1 hypothetical protein APR43_12945 [Flavobacterium sp. NLM]PUU67710.1 DUF1573 domain-containing protein [Flavobacterium sp. WLB]
MKIIKISMLVLALSLMSFSAIAPVKSLTAETKITETASAIVWKAETIDVGEIPQGTPKAIVYEFKNTGKTAVVITQVQGSCGCTATDYTKEPILPGKSAKVTATYNAANKGAFTKTVTVTTSAETAPKILTLKGTVI